MFSRRIDESRKAICFIAMGSISLFLASGLVEAQEVAGQAKLKAGYPQEPVYINTENGWTNLPFNWDSKKVSAYPPEEVRGKYPKSISVTANTDGWVLVAQTANPFSRAQLKVFGQRFERLKSTTFLEVEQMVKSDWVPIGKVSYENAPYILMRKNVKSGESIVFPIQADSGPFIIQSFDQEVKDVITAAKPIDLQTLKGSGESGSEEEMTVTITSGTTGGAFPAGPPSSGMAIPGTGMSVPGSGMFTVMKNIFTGTPASEQPASSNNAFPGANPGMSNPFSAGANTSAKPVDKKAAFIASVSLEELKCPVNRSAVKRELHSDYGEGVLFFSDDEAMAQFDKKATSFAAEANYQLFLSGQAKQKACPVSGKPFDEDVFIQVKSKQVAFESRLAKVKIDRARPLTKFKKIFGSSPFKKAFEVEIPAVEETGTEANQVGNGALQFSNPNQLRNATSRVGAGRRGIPATTTPKPTSTSTEKTNKLRIRGGRERD